MTIKLISFLLTGEEVTLAENITLPPLPGWPDIVLRQSDNKAFAFESGNNHNATYAETTIVLIP